MFTLLYSFYYLTLKTTSSDTSHTAARGFSMPMGLNQVLLGAIDEITRHWGLCRHKEKKLSSTGNSTYRESALRVTKQAWKTINHGRNEGDSTRYWE